MARKLYGSVDRKATQVESLYGSVDGQSKMATKMYGAMPTDEVTVNLYSPAQKIVSVDNIDVCATVHIQKIRHAGTRLVVTGRTIIHLPNRPTSAYVSLAYPIMASLPDGRSVTAYTAGTYLCGDGGNGYSRGSTASFTCYLSVGETSTGRTFETRFTSFGGAAALSLSLAFPPAAVAKLVHQGFGHMSYPPGFRVEAAAVQANSYCIGTVLWRGYNRIAQIRWYAADGTSTVLSSSYYILDGDQLKIRITRSSLSAEKWALVLEKDGEQSEPIYFDAKTSGEYYAE